MLENMDQKNSEYGHFSRKDLKSYFYGILRIAIVFKKDFALLNTIRLKYMAKGNLITVIIHVVVVVIPY